jgi:HipA-like protein
MIQKIMNLFRKNEEDNELRIELPHNEDSKFLLIFNDIKVGHLYCEGGYWYFKYTEEFKEYSSDYNYIVGFPDLNKIYKSETLWPFFQIRIPGLKQPSVLEILKQENIDKTNEVALLRRFGKKTIANPYELVPAL